MSRETLTTLNNNVLVGFTDKRGNAWHYKASEQGDQSNHYPGAIPAADVARRLFDWTAESRPLLVQVPADLDTMTGLSDTGQPVRALPVEGKQAIVRSDTDAVLGIFSTSYAIHQYSEWLLNNVSTLLGDTIQIGSAGVLAGGGQAWVQLEQPDNIDTPQGVSFRPHLLATTSHDGTLSTTYKQAFTVVVCDNTREYALNERTAQFKVKHSRYSNLKLAEARQALNILEVAADDFQAEIAQLCAERVDHKTWTKFVEAVAPMPETAGRGRTLAETKRDALNRLWRSDLRVAPWAGTAYGVVQAMNTWAHHEQTVRGSERADRNMQRAITGGVGKLDRGTLDTLRLVAA